MLKYVAYTLNFKVTKSYGKLQFTKQQTILLDDGFVANTFEIHIFIFTNRDVTSFLILLLISTQKNMKECFVALLSYLCILSDSQLNE